MKIDELKILHGLPIDLGYLRIHPLTCHEVSAIGEDRYNQMLNLVLVKDTGIRVGDRAIGEYETALIYCHEDDRFRQAYSEAWSTFLKEPFHYDEEGFFYVGERRDGRVIYKETFDRMAAVVKKQNFIKMVEPERDYKPHNEKAKQLMDQMKAIKEKINKQNNEKGLDLADIISIVASYGGNLNIFTVWDMTIYQLYMTYMRLIMKDNYESNFYLLPHTSKPESLDLSHWATKIKG